MSIATQLLRAEPIGIRELKTHLSAVLKRARPRVVTERNRPSHFLIPYDDMVEIVEALEELSNARLTSQVAEGRASYRAGKSVPLARLAKDLKLRV